MVKASADGLTNVASVLNDLRKTGSVFQILQKPKHFGCENFSIQFTTVSTTYQTELNAVKNPLNCEAGDQDYSR